LTSVTGANMLQVKKSSNEREVKIDVSHLPAGLYICMLEMGERVIYKKIVIH
jgi:hypothetical protein